MKKFQSFDSKLKNFQPISFEDRDTDSWKRQLEKREVRNFNHRFGGKIYQNI